MAAKDPAKRSAIARIGALTRWSKNDGQAGARHAQQGLRRKFEQQVEAAAEGVLSDAERTRRTDRLLRAHMTKLSLLAADARRARAA